MIPSQPILLSIGETQHPEDHWLDVDSAKLLANSEDALWCSGAGGSAMQEWP